MLPPLAGFRDPTRLTRFLKILLALSIFMGLVAFVSTLAEYQLLIDVDSGKFQTQNTLHDALTANDARERFVGILYLGLYLVTVVVFSVWIYRANYNVRQLGAEGLRFTPGWSVGWYFIPVFSLWKPYQAMKEIWKASANPARWHEQQRGTILPWWWFLFLASGILGNVSGRLALGVKGISQLEALDILLMVSYTFDVVAASVAMLLVSQIFRMQMSYAPRAFEA